MSLVMADAVEKGFSAGPTDFFKSAPVRWSENDVGGHITNPIFNQQPS
jgi:hypothetical protein